MIQEKEARADGSRYRLRSGQDAVILSVGRFQQGHRGPRLLRRPSLTWRDWRNGYGRERAISLSVCLGSGLQSRAIRLLALFLLENEKFFSVRGD